MVSVFVVVSVRSGAGAAVIDRTLAMVARTSGASVKATGRSAAVDDARMLSVQEAMAMISSATVAGVTAVMATARDLTAIEANSSALLVS